MVPEYSMNGMNEYGMSHTTQLPGPTHNPKDQANQLSPDLCAWGYEVGIPSVRLKGQRQRIKLDSLGLGWDLKLRPP